MHDDATMAGDLLEHGADPDLAADDCQTMRSMVEAKPEMKDLLKG